MGARSSLPRPLHTPSTHSLPLRCEKSAKSKRVICSAASAAEEEKRESACERVCEKERSDGGRRWGEGAASLSPLFLSSPPPLFLPSPSPSLSLSLSPPFSFGPSSPPLFCEGAVGACVCVTRGIDEYSSRELGAKRKDVRI